MCCAVVCASSISFLASPLSNSTVHVAYVAMCKLLFPAEFCAWCWFQYSPYSIEVEVEIEYVERMMACVAHMCKIA